MHKANRRTKNKQDLKKKKKKGCVIINSLNHLQN